MQMTVSVSKGKKGESSTSHNERKTNLQDATAEEISAFYEQKGHTHIYEEYRDLNEDLVTKDITEVYDENFSEAIAEYNSKQKRKDRQIGKGKALKVEEKNAKIVLLETALKYKKLGVTTDNLGEIKTELPDDAYKKARVASLKLSTSKTVKQLKHELSKTRQAPTLGKALYEKQKAGKQSRASYEFVFQLGSVTDYYETNSEGQLITKDGDVLQDASEDAIKKNCISLDRRDPDGIWQRSKHALKAFYKDFEKRNPNLAVFDASIHMDESSPHLHVEVVPVAELEKTKGYGKKKRNGLKVKPSFNAALELEGFARSSKDNRAQFTEWRSREADALTEAMYAYTGATRKLGKTNRLKDFKEYKEARTIATAQREATKTVSKLTQPEGKPAKPVVLMAQKAQATHDLGVLELSTSSQYKQLQDVKKQTEKAKSDRRKALEEKAAAEKQTRQTLAQLTETREQLKTANAQLKEVQDKNTELKDDNYKLKQGQGFWKKLVVECSETFFETVNPAWSQTDPTTGQTIAHGFATSGVSLPTLIKKEVKTASKRHPKRLLKAVTETMKKGFSMLGDKDYAETVEGVASVVSKLDKEDAKQTKPQPLPATPTPETLKTKKSIDETTEEKEFKLDEPEDIDF